VEAYIIYLNVSDGVTIEEKTSDLRSILTESKVTPISEFVSQTLGGITGYMSMVEGAAMAISLILIVLITVMILQLITAREHSAVAIKKAIGFSTRDIRMQFGIRIIVIQFLAIVVGTVLANYLGEAIFGLMLSSIGASKITMLVDPVRAYLLCPAVQLIVVFTTVIIGTSVVKSYHIKDQIIE
jgi:putative ABC transport system permease protein